MDSSFLSSSISGSVESRAAGGAQQAPANGLNTGQPLNDQRRPMRQASGPEFEAAVQQREALSYDEPGDNQRRAVGQYQQVARFEQRDQIQQMVGVDLYV